ncbi:CLUMA_CG009223, isoform A [Clunio marinus]|uniref:CLUMA_CG009223, isoform A n=1 Tax=Clunio marinus TaxID=568069 RepID=A0A1J1I9X4_9DIPT|nr:CLUMA_CG009223, isoform A [Clunio marinus]
MHHSNKEIFEEICDLISDVDCNGDAIMQTLKLRTISEKFRTIVKDEKILSEIFEMFNCRCLISEEFILSFVAVVTSRQLESFTADGKNLRHATISILQKNNQNADNFKRDNLSKFYNSVRLHGEYFNKARLSGGIPINIIGKSLLSIINVELEKELRNIFHLKTDEFAKIILSQITLNGNLLKTRHKTDIEQTLFNIRKCLIEINSLTSKTKAFLIMTLDLYYSNFTNIGDSLEKMYKAFLIEDDKVNAKPSNHVDDKKVNATSKVRASLGQMTITKKPDDSPKQSHTQRNLKLQIKKPDSLPSTPTRNSSKYHQKSSPSKVSTPPTSPQKKLSPQELRSKKGQASNGLMRNETSNKSPKQHSTNGHESESSQNVDENVLKQQNSRSSTPAATASSNTKYKTNSQVYFREENVENLTWNGEVSFEGDPDDPEATTSPKVNPYSSSFLNFLSSN